MKYQNPQTYQATSSSLFIISFHLELIFLFRLFSFQPFFFLFRFPCFPPSIKFPSHATLIIIISYHFDRLDHYDYVMALDEGSKKHKHNKKLPAATTNAPRRPTKPDLKNMVKAQKPKEPKSSEDSSQKSKNFSKLALDSLLSKNKNSQFTGGKFSDSNDYLERLNDNQPSESEDEEYDDDDEGTIHPISSGTDPNVLLHALTHSQKHHQTFTDEVSHFSNPHINPVTRKNPSDESKHPLVPLPGPPRAVQAVIVKPRFVTLNWLEPVENPDEVVSYTVFYKMNAADAR